MATGFYPGSFDPLTWGHMDIIASSLNFLDKLTIGIGVHHQKKALISAEDRMALIAQCVANEGLDADKVDIVTFDGLSVEAARAHGARILVRGLRDSGDFSYEMRIAAMNETLDQGLKTVFLPASLEHRHISSTVVRQILTMDGDISGFVPQDVAKFLKAQ